MIFKGRFSYQAAQHGGETNSSLPVLSQEAVQALRDMLRRVGAESSPLQPAQMPHNFAK